MANSVKEIIGSYAIKSLFEGNVNTNILLFMGLYTKSNVPKNIISSTKSAPLDAT